MSMADWSIADDDRSTHGNLGVFRWMRTCVNAPVFQTAMAWALDVLAALRVFVRVAETGSFSAVAREVGATQPAVSRQVAALEEHLGARLIQRTTRSLALTEDGRDLLGHARQVLDAVEEAEASVGRRHSLPSGLVRLGTSSTVGRL